jgi:hypothetical protein
MEDILQTHWNACAEDYIEAQYNISGPPYVSIRMARDEESIYSIGSIDYNDPGSRTLLFHKWSGIEATIAIIIV